MRQINKLILHCSATPNGRITTVEDINRWHKARGWREIGYHYVIYGDGVVHKGRETIHIGAHCKGQNTDSIGICMVGTDKFSKAQWTILRGITRQLEQEFKGCGVHGHREFNVKKLCPGFSVKDWLRRDKEPLIGEILDEF